MTQEQAGLGEQALNKIAQMAIASQLKEAEQLEVRINTDLSKLARGEVDSIAIKINGLVVQNNLRVEELQLQINRVTVKPFSALFGKIQLTQPSTGIVQIVLNEDNLTRAFNSKSFYEHLHQMSAFVKDKHLANRFQQVKCYLLADSNITINAELILGKTGETKLVAFTTTPHISTEKQGIVLQDLHYQEGKELSPELTAALVTQISEVLSLRNFESKGMSLRIQQLDVAVGKLTLQANVYIEQFPSSYN